MAIVAAIVPFVGVGSLLADDAVADAANAADTTGSGTSILEWIPLLSALLTPLAMFVLWRRRDWWPPPAGTPTPWRIPAGASFALFALAFVTGGILGGLVGDRIGSVFPDDRLLRMAITTWAGVLGGLLGAAPGIAIARQEDGSPDTPAPWPLVPSIVAGVVGLILALPAVQLVSTLGTLLQRWISGIDPDPLAHDTLQLLMSQPADLGWWLIALGAVLGAPLLEEIIYRGFLQQGMRRLGIAPWIAIMATSALFALMHLPAIPADGRLSALAGLFTLSIALGMLRERAGRLTPCIVAHALFNAFNLLLAGAATA